MCVYVCGVKKSAKSDKGIIYSVSFRFSISMLMMMMMMKEVCDGDDDDDDDDMTNDVSYRRRR